MQMQIVHFTNLHIISAHLSTISPICICCLYDNPNTVIIQVNNNIPKLIPISC